MDSRARSRTGPRPKGKVQKLGRYYLLNRIAQGGFAEVYRAVLDAGEGVHRLVAVKCLHSDHGTDSEFSRAFRSEIKVSLGLAHPNIVPTFDFGDEGGRPYIVFEYIHGRSLRQVLTRMSERSRVLSVEHAAFIIEQSAAALHYAHTFRDPISRDPIEIIHRDVSPQNILISFEGVPKIIDFGIAKVMAAVENSQNQDERTRTGVIKGKPAYLSPEQIRGDTLDGRSDVFALGIVLWETLTGVRLFGGKEHSLAIQAIMDTSYRIEPPSNINPAVPPELDLVVLNALARSREDRYRNARDFQNGLVKFLTKADGAKSRDQYHSELSELLSDVFADELETDQAELRRLNEQVNEIAQSEGRRLEGQPREFSLEELSMIGRAQPDQSDQFGQSGTARGEETKRKDSTESTVMSTASAHPPQRLGQTIVMLPLPDKIPVIPLDSPVNRAVMPEPEPRIAPRIAPEPKAAPKPAPEPEIESADAKTERMPRPALSVKPSSRPRLRIVKGEREDSSPPQPFPSAPPLPPGYEASLSQTFSRPDIQPPHSIERNDVHVPKPPVYRVVFIFIGVILAVWFINKVFKLRTGGGFRDPISNSSRQAPQPTDSSRSDTEDGKTVEPEAAPEYKDYSVPPIDIVPGNSRVPGK